MLGTFCCDLNLFIWSRPVFDPHMIHKTRLLNETYRVIALWSIVRRLRLACDKTRAAAVSQAIYRPLY